MNELGRTGELLDKDAYSRLFNTRLWSWRIAVADADEKYSRLPRQDTGGSDALCLGTTPVLAKLTLVLQKIGWFWTANLLSLAD